MIHTMTKHLSILVLYFVTMALCIGIGPGSFVFAGSEPTDVRLLVHITSDDFHTVNMGLMLAGNMQKAHRDVSIFFDIEGVKVALKTPPADLAPALPNVKAFLSEGGKVFICPHCLASAGYQSADILPGIEELSSERMAKLLEGHLSIIDY